MLRFFVKIRNLQLTSGQKRSSVGYIPTAKVLYLKYIKFVQVSHHHLSISIYLLIMSNSIRHIDRLKSVLYKAATDVTWLTNGTKKIGTKN